jgi:CheY-like chemotaxis protein
MTKKVLYVGDPDEIDLVPSFLQSEGGFELDIVYTAEDAERAVSSEKYRGVFMGSLRLPLRRNCASGDKEGLDLIRMLKEKGLAVIVLTEAGPDKVEEAKRLGASRVIPKLASFKDYIPAAKELFGRED